MITGPLRSKIDKLWEEFWTGGITNPLTVIEQISFLMFARLLDAREVAEEKRHARLHKGQAFDGKYFDADQQQVRWKNLKHEGDAAKVLELVRDELFPHMRSLGARGRRAPRATARAPPLRSRRRPGRRSRTRSRRGRPRSGSGCRS